MKKPQPQKWKHILNWLDKFTKNKKNINKKDSNEDVFWKNVENIKDHTLVIFTKKGLMLDKIFNKNLKMMYLFLLTQ